MIIRPARDEDLPLLPAVEASAATLFRGTAMEEITANVCVEPERFAEGAAAGTLWVAQVEGVVAGFLLGAPCDCGFYVDEMSVHADYQRRGIGRALMAAGIAHARAATYPAIVLTTDRWLPWNAPFYASLGFEEIAPADLSPDLIAWLALEAAQGMDAARRCAMAIRLS